MTDTNDKRADSRPPLAAMARWCLQGLRGAFLLRIDWRGLRGTPAPLLLAVVVFEMACVGLGRLFIEGPATFYPAALSTQLTVAAISAWSCWFILPIVGEYRDPRRHPPDAPTLLTLLFVQATVLTFVIAGVFAPASRAGFFDQASHSWLVWWLGLAPTLWTVAIVLRQLLASRAAGLARRWLACVIVSASTVGAYFFLPTQFWYAASPRTAFQDTRLHLTQEVMELQPKLLASQLDAIAPQRPGVVDMYAITFAPYADVDVFMRESAVVADVMQSRFDTRGRTLQLVNNRQTETTLPWATPLNLQRAIERVAQRMDKREDILFIHLTSHGAADGELAASARPLAVDSVTPQALRKWLDDAGIRNRVISISACFSGSWIAPLANDDTLVMTAADADHTSYGCGSKSTLTFFGQAMYDEQLRHTWSFEAAHAASRRIIDQRERAAGKDDGYSNPQISVGPRIRERLKALEARLAASAAR